MPLSRRTFVEQALAMAGAALAADRAGAGESVAAAKPTVGPNDKIRVAVVGFNNRGLDHIQGWLHNPGADLAAWCDCDPGVEERALNKFRDIRRTPRFEQDFRRLLEDKSIDAVSIASPNHWHALMAVWAMQAGKDVYLEKPCSFTLEEGRITTDWARKLGRICQMGVQSRSNTGMRQAIEFIHAGTIGAVKVAHALCYKRRPSIGLVDTPAPLPPGIDFDLWAGPAPAVVPHRRKLHYDWHWNRLTGNGDLGNQNPHELDKARWGLGKNTLPKRVVSLGGRLGYHDNGDTANSQLSLFQWDDAIVISEVRGLEIKTPPTIARQAGPVAVADIWWGTEGYVVAPNYNSGVAFDYDGKQLGKWSGGTDQLHYDNFLEAVRSRDRSHLHLDIEEGHLSSALAHLGNVSWSLGKEAPLGTRPTLAADEPHVAETFAAFEEHIKDNGVDLADTPLLLGRELSIDPATEKSADPEANALFTREYRKGFELPRA
ncbi:MAG: gfo/Idh/MocA family oxidoreductase [Planctomycetia bacterium]|nr:gfo/Idh/MocA family oxidoreductase [Planctomycetia bacterium]